MEEPRLDPGQAVPRAQCLTGVLFHTLSLLVREGSPPITRRSQQGLSQRPSCWTHNPPTGSQELVVPSPPWVLPLSPLYRLTSDPIGGVLGWLDHRLLSLLQHDSSENVCFEDSHVTCNVLLLQSPLVFCSVSQGEPGEKGVPGKEVSIAHLFCPWRPFPGAAAGPASWG